MKKSLKILISLFAIMSILFSACKSTPEAKPEPKPKPKVEKTGPSQAELDAAKERERLLAELERLQAEEGPLQKARERAIELEADKAYPEEFALAELLVKNAKADIEADKLQEAIDKFNEAIDRYNTLSNLMLAKQMKTEIEENSFARYASDDFDEAEKMFSNTLEHYKLDSKMAFESSEDALTLYKKVINEAYYQLAEDARMLAKEAKADCDSIKVARSRTEDYNSSVRLFNVGKGEVELKEFKKAYIAFKGAAEQFKLLYEEVSVKRAEAEKAMEEAAKKQEESSKLALEADKESPLTDAIEGFNDEELELEDKSSPLADTPVEGISGEETDAETTTEAETPAEPKSESKEDNEVLMEETVLPENEGSVIQDIQIEEESEAPKETTIEEADMDLGSSESIESVIQEIEIEDANTDAVEEKDAETEKTENSETNLNETEEETLIESIEVEELDNKNNEEVVETVEVELESNENSASEEKGEQ